MPRAGPARPTLFQPTFKINISLQRDGKKAILSLLCAVALLPAGARESRNFADLSIEELMNEPVTSVSKRAQKLGDSAAAISVLSQDDLHRSGATSVAEALRLVPGMNVASASSSDWAVSARGFNGIFSKKLLVLVDGRATYNTIFSGVFWDLQQTMLEDVDRIEVIRGPGATVWGANAVNGVINVATRSARETQGGFVYGGGGDLNETLAGARYGGQLGERTYFRIFGATREKGPHRQAGGAAADDAWRGEYGGFRLDHFADPQTQFTWQADATSADFVNDAVHSSNVNTLARWTRQLPNDASIEAQIYYDQTRRYSTSQARLRADTYDLSLQHNASLGARNMLVSGLGYRRSHSVVAPTNPFLTVQHGTVDMYVVSAFVQDEFQLVPERLALTAGVKLEHNDTSGFEFQPSVRAAFKVDDKHTLWAAVSRAVRTPDAVEGRDIFDVALGAPFVGPDGGLYLPTAVGSGNPGAEVLWAYELGYRTQLSSRLNVDVAAFHNNYSHLVSYHELSALIPGTPLGIAEFPARNLLSAHSDGAEISVVYAATDALRISSNYSFLHMRVRTPPGYALVSGAESSPRTQFLVRASYDFTSRASLDAQVRRLGAIDSAPGYTTADARLAWRITDELEFAVVGQNLLQRQHLEQGPMAFGASAEIPRSFHVKLLWKF